MGSHESMRGFITKFMLAISQSSNTSSFSICRPPFLAPASACVAFAFAERVRWRRRLLLLHPLTSLQPSSDGQLPLLLNPLRWRGRRWWRQWTSSAISSRGHRRLVRFLGQRDSDCSWIATWRHSLVDWPPTAAGIHGKSLQPILVIDNGSYICKISHHWQSTAERHKQRQSHP